MLTQSENYMECAISLAKLAMGYTSPNPAVGAVIAKDGFITGMGYTQPTGSEHAEVMALRQAGDGAKKATMYVTLEPCCHYGRTPPCTKSIIDAELSETHIALLDPNPLVSGHGVKQLNEAGIKTYMGECQQEAYEINEAYIKYITTGLPFVIAKFAVSLDGKIATKSGDSKWITNNEARKYAHMLRHTVDAIMVGINTVITDNPHLTARGCGGKGGIKKKQPLRVIVDSKGRTPSDSHIFEPPGKTLVAIAESLKNKRRKELMRSGIEVLKLPSKDGLVDIEELLKTLGKRETVSVLVEGGGKLLGSLFDHHLADKVMAFISPIIIGGYEAKTAVEGQGINHIAESWHLSRVATEQFDDNVLISGYV
ncbi:MAG: bifunctional diaminohydroxyphosphoribosylaminopyrimidine deaminase/5-amino-6-(5-phosphoribosylamino)uracil reductase RibD [Chloroflexota bacterium]|nr:bifunctional diaminohydroxyphosphoribosylaminopyrimidine deaminase/5-amino-6-(5-phosphoribosylamino)uracil reductase RibD [Chloroflexota bacterium]